MSHVRLFILWFCGSFLAVVPNTAMRLKNFRTDHPGPPTMRVNSPLGAFSN